MTWLTAALRGNAVLRSNMLGSNLLRGKAALRRATATTATTLHVRLAR
jgi:hypothetical protein